MARSTGIWGSAQQTQIVKLEALDASQSYFSQVPNFRPNNDAGFEEEFGRFASFCYKTSEARTLLRRISSGGTLQQ